VNTRRPLSIWTIYDSPDDFPGKYVARMWAVTSLGPKATENVIIAQDLLTLRRVLLEDLHLTCLQRSWEDDDVIVESWV
jgi:hypothetical protein